MARISQLITTAEVQDKASGPLNAIGAAADRAGAAFEGMDTRVRRNEASFEQVAARLDVVERAAQKVERATSSFTRSMEAAERQALAQGIAQERLNQVLVSGAAAREAAAMQAVRGLTAEQQAAALTRAGYANLAAQVQATAQAQTAMGVTASQRLAAANDNATASSGRMSGALGAAGFQIQDFATQVSMGQNALVAFGTQFSQLAGFFGPAGAIAGAGVMIGVIAAQLIGMGESAQEAERKIEAAFNAIKLDSEGVRDVIKEIGDLYLTAAERAQNLARAQREVLSQNVDLRLSNAIQFQDAAATRIPQLEREIVVLERRAAIEAAANEQNRRAARGGGNVAVDQTTDATSALFVARSQLNGLRAELDLQDRRIRELNEARQRLANAGSDQGYGPYGPEAPRAERARASTERLSEAAREYNEIMREAEGQVTRTMSEEEKRANILDRLSQMLAEGSITGDQYIAATEAQRRAVEAVAAQEQQRASERAQAEAARTAQRAAENIERQNQQTTDSIVRYGADRFADMFSENSRGWAGMLDTFRNTFRSLMARLAAEAIIRPIIAPIVQGLGLGQLGAGGGGLGSFLGFGGSTLGGAGAVADAGGMQSGLTQAAQVAGLRQAGSFGNLGNAFTNQGAAATGYGWLDGALNTQLITPQLNSLTPVVGAPGTFLPAGAQGPVLPAALPVAEGGLSVAGAIGGAASIAGGAYGIYSGLQRGGPGGYTSAAGGALSAGLGVAMLAGATIPVAGWVLAGLLAIAGAALPGQQQSGRGQLSRINLNTANQSFEGLGGDRYSQGNRDAATNTVNSIADMARRIGDQLGGARIGGDVAVGVTSSRGNGPGQLYLQIGANTQQFSNDEQGSQQLAETAARLILEEFRRQGTAQGDYASILAASGSVEQLSQNLTWYEDVYKTLTKAKEPVSAFQQSLDAMAAQFEPAIQKARELGLSVDAMTQAREREIAKLHEQRDAQVRSFDMGLEARGQRLAGNNQWADIIEFNEQATAYLAQTRASLESLGLSAEDVAARITNAEAVLGGERLQIVQRYADEALAAETAAAAERQRLAEQTASAQVSAARTALDWLNNQALGASSSLSPTARLAEAERQFNAAMNGGDVRALTSAADALLSSSAAVYGTASAEYAQRESATRRVVLNQGNAASWGNGDQAALAAVAQLQVAFSTELASLRSAFLEMVAETRRANDKAMVA
jgi:hypothetical protein